MATTKKKLPIATPEEFEGQTLMHMRTENCKRVRLIDISVRDSLTLIGGDNDQGKTSFLDSYGWCLGGKTEIQMDPIRHGQQTGSVRCDFGDGETVKLSVIRTLKRVGDKEWTADVVLEIPGYLAPSRIEEFLRRLTGEFAFDPMVFDRLTPPEQFEAMQKFVAGFDFKANALERQTLYTERTDVGRDQRREQSAAEAIVIAKDPPGEHIDEAELQQSLIDTERRRSNREKAVDAIRVARELIARTDANIASARTKSEAIRDREVSRLEELIREVRRTCDEAIERESTAMRAEARQAEVQADELQKKLDAAPPLLDTEELASQLTAARESNKALLDWQSLRDRRKRHQDSADSLTKGYDELTAQIAALDEAKAKAISDAKLPIEGIGFGDGYITLPAADGSGPVPWSQAGTAVRTDASFAIAMALQPKLKVILIRDGSNVGRTIRERIRQRAAEKGYRVLMEVVEENSGTHVVIEDGVVKQLAATNAA